MLPTLSPLVAAEPHLRLGPGDDDDDEAPIGDPDDDEDYEDDDEEDEDEDTLWTARPGRVAAIG